MEKRPGVMAYVLTEVMAAPPGPGAKYRLAALWAIAEAIASGDDPSEASFRTKREFARAALGPQAGKRQTELVWQAVEELSAISISGFCPEASSPRRGLVRGKPEPLLSATIRGRRVDLVLSRHIAPGARMELRSALGPVVWGRRSKRKRRETARIPVPPAKVLPGYKGRRNEAYRWQHGYAQTLIEITERPATFKSLTRSQGVKIQEIAGCPDDHSDLVSALESLGIVAGPKAGNAPWLQTWLRNAREYAKEQEAAAKRFRKRSRPRKWSKRTDAA